MTTQLQWKTLYIEFRFRLLRQINAPHARSRIFPTGGQKKSAPREAGRTS